MLDRFVIKVGPATPAGCREWQGATRRGYGVFWLDGRLVPAHRVAYEAAFGPVPDGLELDHLCRNRACTEPTHLEPVTRAENLRRIPRRAALVCIRGHKFTDENTLWRSDGRRRCRACHRDRECARYHATREDGQ